MGGVDVGGGAVVEQLHLAVPLPVVGREDRAHEAGRATSHEYVERLPVGAARARDEAVVEGIDDGGVVGMGRRARTLNRDAVLADAARPRIPLKVLPDEGAEGPQIEGQWACLTLGYGEGIVGRRNSRDRAPA